MAVSVAVVATAGGGLRGVGVASAAAALGVTLIAGVVVGRRRSLVARRPASAEVRAFVRYAGTVSVLQGTGVLHRTMDRTIAGVAFGPGAVALAEIANQIQMGSTALLTSTTYPMLSSGPWLRARGDDSALRGLLDRLTRYSVLLTVPLVAMIVVFAGPFVRVWVGTEFSEAIGLTQVAVLYVAVAAPLQAGSNLLQSTGHAGVVLRATSRAVLVNLAASILLVNVVGLVGVFLGTIVGTLVLTPMLIRAIDRNAGADTFRLALDALRRALPPALAAAAVGVAFLLLDLPDLLTLALGGWRPSWQPPSSPRAGRLDPGERAELLGALRRGPAV